MLLVTTDIYSYLHPLSLRAARPISRSASISWADSRLTAASYFPATAELWITAARSAGLSGPDRDEGGRISVRSTGVGAPSACSSDTSASPTFRDRKSTRLNSSH